jgi:hypothetical protein
VILAVLAILILGPVAPTATPGVVDPTVTPAAVCSTRWGTDARHVSEAMKQAVARRYGVRYPAIRAGHRLTAAERAQRAKWEIDHLIPRELGGADDVDNLWPQPIADAHVKDRRENALHRAVCGGAVSLEAARAEMRAWGKGRRR